MSIIVKITNDEIEPYKVVEKNTGKILGSALTVEQAIEMAKDLIEKGKE